MDVGLRRLTSHGSPVSRDPSFCVRIAPRFASWFEETEPSRAKFAARNFFVKRLGRPEQISSH